MKEHNGDTLTDEIQLPISEYEMADDDNEYVYENSTATVEELETSARFGGAPVAIAKAFAAVASKSKYFEVATNVLGMVADIVGLYDFFKTDEVPNLIRENYDAIQKVGADVKRLHDNIPAWNDQIKYVQYMHS